jgi:hypothetical protein
LEAGCASAAEPKARRQRAALAGNGDKGLPFDHLFGPIPINDAEPKLAA